MNTKSKNWICIECGQECVAKTNPTESFPKWEDGHRCKFEEVKNE